MSDLAFIEQLEELIRSRLRESPEGSYTARLAASGTLAVAQKVGEEGVELALAGASEPDDKLVAEAADLLFHLLVLLAVRDVPLARVIDLLAQRHRERETK